MFLGLSLAVFLFLPLTVGAIADSDPHDKAAIGFDQFLMSSGYGDFSTYQQKGAAYYISTIVRTALSFVGVILLLIIMYAGFRWMTAGGNEDQITEAQTWLRNAVIGLALIVLAYALAYFVTYWLSNGFLGGPYTSD